MDDYRAESTSSPRGIQASSCGGEILLWFLHRDDVCVLTTSESARSSESRRRSTGTNSRRSRCRPSRSSSFTAKPTIDPLRIGARVLRPAQRTEGARRDAIAPITSSTGRRAKSPTRSRTCSRTSHARCRNRFRHAQPRSARRHTAAEDRSPDEMAAAVIGEACAAPRDSNLARSTM